MSTFLNASPIFGPVRSRRLGLSLGVNMMPASGKICTFDCIYCENGLNAERPCHEPYNTAAVVLDALEAKLREMAAEGEQRRGRDIACIRAESDGFEQICGVADGAADDHGNLIADAFVAQALKFIWDIAAVHFQDAVLMLPFGL